MSDLVDDMSISSNSEIDPIGDLIIDQMSISEITDYIDQDYHDITSETWLGELQFPIIINWHKYSSSEGYGSSKFQNLSNDLSIGAVKCGYNIVHNGSRVWKANGIKMVRFVCSRYRNFRGSTRCVDNSEFNFRYHDFHDYQKIVM